jgi:hypothetical protein
VYHLRISSRHPHHFVHGCHQLMMVAIMVVLMFVLVLHGATRSAQESAKRVQQGGEIMRL